MVKPLPILVSPPMDSELATPIFSQEQRMTCWHGVCKSLRKH
jgi:hypothetical protein